MIGNNGSSCLPSGLKPIWAAVGESVCVCGRLIRADKYDLTNFRPHKYSEKIPEESVEIVEEEVSVRRVDRRRKRKLEKARDGEREK